MPLLMKIRKKKKKKIKRKKKNHCYSDKKLRHILSCDGKQIIYTVAQNCEPTLNCFKPLKCLY